MQPLHPDIVQHVQKFGFYQKTHGNLFGSPYDAYKETIAFVSKDKMLMRTVGYQNKTGETKIYSELNHRGHLHGWTYQINPDGVQMSTYYKNNEITPVKEAIPLNFATHAEKTLKRAQKQPIHTFNTVRRFFSNLNRMISTKEKTHHKNDQHKRKTTSLRVLRK